MRYNPGWESSPTSPFAHRSKTISSVDLMSVKKSGALLWQYRGVLLKYRRALSAGILALVATNLLAVAIPWQVKQAVESLQHGETQAMHASLWLILGISAMMLCVRVASRVLLLGVGRKMEYDLRNNLYQHLLTLPSSYFQVNPTGELMSRLTSDVGAIRYLSGGGIMLGFNTVLAYATTFPMMAMISPQLTLFAFLLYPIGIYLMRGISGRVKTHFYGVQSVLGDISTITQENLSGMSVIQAYAKEPEETQRFQRVCARYFDTYRLLIKERVMLYLVMAVVSGLSFFMVLAEGGREVLVEAMDLGGFIAFTLYLERLAWPTMAMGWTLTIFQQGAAALQRIDEVLRAKSNLKPPPDVTPIDTPPAVTGLTLKDLTFSYQNPYEKTPPAEPPPPVLQNISLSVQPGETVALVGSVGSGKSTLLNLIARQYDVLPGHIFIGETDITHLTLPALRQVLALMPQQNFLFSTTIQRNIAYGDPAAAADDIIAWADTASLHQEVQQFEQQYKTIVGERGVMLSGGQRQRLAMARALLLEAPILLLDDPFSHLDAETETRILEGLRARKILQNRITLISTHRFSLVKEADRVVLLDAGRLLAVGTHAELLATQPVYQRLNRLAELKEALGDSLMTELPEEGEVFG